MRTAMAMAAGFLLRPRAWKSFVAWENDRQHPLTDDEGFERFVTDRVGRSAYEKFYRPYVEKVWGENPSDLSRSVAKQRASMSSPLRALAKGIKVGRSRGASFLYPKHGMTSIVQHLRGQLKKFGVRIRYGRHASLEQLQQTSFSNILYSGQIADLHPDAGFEHRGLYLLHIALPEDVVGPEDTFYAPESRYWFGRVSRPDRFSPSLGRPGETTLCVEIPQGRWGTKRDFQSETEEILSQLLKARILKYPADALETSQVFLPRVYPMYRRGWYQGWLRALSRLNEADARILPIGRQGLFLHCNLDHCIRISADAVDHVSSRRDAASWTERARSYLDLRVRD